jgi:apolipoprotein N-acyltransferase
LTLIQLASLTGTAGITFLIAWFASIVAWMARPGLETGRRVRAAGAFAIVILVVIVFGQLRLAGGDTGGSVRTASLVPSRPLLDDLERSLGPVRGGAELSESDMRAIQAAATRLNNDLLRRTRREAQAGAKLIAWSETAGRVLASEEEKLVAYASRLAAEEGIVLMLALGVWHPDGVPPFENKVVAIDATGAVAWEYHKANPIVGAESSVIAAGGNLIKSLDQEFGRVGAVICHDLDFQPLLRQASAERIGLVVGPSDDWSDVAWLHGRMAVFRAVENGFTLLRPTNGGRSMAVDTRGRVIAQVDSPDDVMVAHVSARRSRTLYGSVGDLFSWLCLVGLALYVITRKRMG